MPHVSYFWDEMEDNVVEEYDGDTGNTIATYTTEPTKYGSVLSQDRGGEKRYFQFDGQGNTTELTDGAGNVTDERRYSAFGETTASSGATSTPFGFGGRWGYHSGNADAFVTIRRRMFIAGDGRWLAVDPIADVEEERHPYIYVGNNPATFSDPSGLRIWDGSLFDFDVTSCQVATPPACCCCPEDIAFENFSDDTELSGVSGVFRSFDTVVKVQWRPAAMASDCTLEWHERSNIPRSMPIPISIVTPPPQPIPGSNPPSTTLTLPQEWTNLYVRAHRFGNKRFDLTRLRMWHNWRDKEPVTTCEPPVGRQYTIRDSPGYARELPPPRPYTLWIVVVARSAPECRCSTNMATGFIKLEFRAGATGRETVGRWTGPPTFPNGIR